MDADAGADADVLGCRATLFDPNHELDAAQVERAIERTAVALGAEVHVRAEQTVDAGLDARMAQLEERCPTWTASAERAPDLVVVMYSAVEREASVYYGADQGLALEDRWEPAVDAMTARFRDGDLTGGVVNGLLVLRDPSSAPLTDPIDDDAGTVVDDGDDGSSSSEGLPGIVWLGIVGVAALLIYNVVRYLDTGEWGDEGGDDDDAGGGTSRWTSSSRRRSSSSSSRSSARRSSSGSGRSSSSRRRSGGGTKKW
jgi:hypothetical protein